MENTFETSIGNIKGIKTKEGYYIFKGIPYIKTERFKEPEIINDLGDFDATIGETEAIQESAYKKSDGFYDKEFYSERTFQYDESVQSLNIITPSMTGKNPVLIFFHGGGYETGMAGDLPYGTTIEYAKRGIVLVSVGYRLNVFGLYNAKNYNLMDQMASIDYVIKNIESFGGDKNRITIMGQSAGAMSVMNLLCNPDLNGKIQAAIMMSGGGVFPFYAGLNSKKKSLKLWHKMVKNSGLNPETCSAEELYNLWHDFRFNLSPLEGIKFMQPCVDGITVKEPQKKTLNKGNMVNVPMMVGVTSLDIAAPFMYKIGYKLGMKLSKENHKNVYGYYFDRVLPGSSYKAFHAADLWYMFGSLDKCWRPFNETDEKLKDEMIDHVSALIKTGRIDDDIWKPISGKNKNYMVFDGENKRLISDHECTKTLWHNFLKEKGPF